MEKMAWDGAKRGREVFFPTNPDPSDIFGDMDFDFDNFHFLLSSDSKFLDFQVPRFPKSGPWPGLGRARPGLSHLDQKKLIFYCKYWCLGQADISKSPHEPLESPR